VTLALTVHNFEKYHSSSRVLTSIARRTARPIAVSCDFTDHRGTTPTLQDLRDSARQHAVCPAPTVVTLSMRYGGELAPAGDGEPAGENADGGGCAAEEGTSW
jgi:hypothetical protein